MLYLCADATWPVRASSRAQTTGVTPVRHDDSVTVLRKLEWNTIAPVTLSKITVVKILKLTWSISSKSRAIIFFNSDTFLWKWRIVSRPKVGTWRNLHGITISSATESAMTNKLSHRRSSSAKTVPLRLCTMRSKWMKIDFQTPNSNSCNKSTTSMKKKSKPV